MSHTDSASTSSDSEIRSTAFDYFLKNDYSTWSYQNFYDYFKTERPNSKLSEIKFYYKLALNHVKKSKKSSIAMRCKAGHLIANSRMLPTEIESRIPSNNIVINGANSGRIEINQDAGSTAGGDDRRKRIKLNIQKASCWSLEDEQDIWSAWREYLDECECHENCLEKMHIIQCGYSIKCHPEIPEELYLHLDTNNHTVENPFSHCAEFIQNVFEAANANIANDGNSGHKEVEKAINEIDFNDNDAKFVQNFLNFMMVFFRKKSINKISISESYFNYAFVWPLVELAVEAASNNNISFVPGEYVLQASKEEYKADAVVLDELHNLEICIVETSGSYKLSDIPRFGYDHVKGCFGVLALLNAIIKKYHKAKLASVLQLVVPFVHVRGDCVHLWGLELCDRKLYAFKKLYKAEIPTGWGEKANVLSNGVLLTILMKMSKKLAEQINDISKEHNDFEATKLLCLREKQGKDDYLLNYINTDIKKPLKGSNYGVLLPCESEDCDIKYRPASSF